MKKQLIIDSKMSINIQTGSVEADLNLQLASAIISRKYPQNPLLNARRFADHLGDRGRHVWESRLEELDESGLFCPLLKVIHASSYHRIISRAEDGNVSDYDENPLPVTKANEDDVVEVFQSEPHSQAEWQSAWDEKRITFCSPQTFAPWKSLRSDDIRTASLFYHPFQTFAFFDAQVASRARINLLQHEFTPEEAWKTFQHFHERLNQLREEKRTEITWKKHLLLLLLIEDRYIPTLREVVSYNNESYRQGKNWEEWADAFVAEDALSKSKMSIEEVKKFHNDMAFHARTNDPNREWFSVIRHMPYDRRQRVKGDTRLAWDYYELTELLGDFLQDATGERQRLPDDVTSMDYWKEKAFGIPAEQIDYKRGNALPGIIRHFGLDPRNRVWMFVEGATEVAFIKRWFGEYNIELASSRIVLVDLGGTSGLSSSIFLAQADEARNQGAPVFVLVDADNERTKRETDLQKWVERGFITTFATAPSMDDTTSIRVGGYVWEPCFEDHNFTVDEQLQAWRLMLEMEHGQGSIYEHEFATAMEEVRAGGHGTYIKAIEKITKSKQRTLLVNEKAFFNKPKMGEALATLFHNTEKPICRILGMLYQIATLRTGVYSLGDNQVSWTIG